jgi:hypothetical protein
MKISKDKINKIKEDILSLLYTNSLKLMFTSEIAHEIARDEEFTKRLLKEMEKENLVVLVNRNPDGIKYSLRCRWRLSSPVYDSYKKIQERQIDYDERNNTYSYSE